MARQNAGASLDNLRDFRIWGPEDIPAFIHLQYPNLHSLIPFLSLVNISISYLFTFATATHTVTMSSPARRSTRSSQARSSPAPGAVDAAPDASQTPRQSRAAQLASSPMFFESSPANGGAANAAPSSPLRQMSNSQSTTNNGAAASSPLRQQTASQSVNDGDRTPRASGLAIGGMYCLYLNPPSVVFSLNKMQSPRRSATIPARALATNRPTCEVRQVDSLSTLLGSRTGQDVVISTPNTRTRHP